LLSISFYPKNQPLHSSKMPPEKKLIFVTKEDIGKRIDSILAKKELGFSRSRVQELISTGKVLVNSKAVKPSYKLKFQDTVEIEITPLKTLALEAENLSLDIVYEDSDLLVVNKKAGMIVHPAGPILSGTLVNALLYHCKDLSGINGVLRPGIVHRLDKNTTGLLVVAKNDFSHNFLAEQIKKRNLKREYAALICGNLPQFQGIIEAPIGRSPKDRKKMAVTLVKSREAITQYQVKESFILGDYLSISLKTGRTHQIRVHFSHLGYPILGDPEYGGRKKWVNSLPPSKRVFALDLLKLIDRQALHSKKIGFFHPQTKEYLQFETQLPEDFTNALNYLRSHLAK
jgi:23S rRNA pseudouridine1911/1915/1917 synthase